MVSAWRVWVCGVWGVCVEGVVVSVYTHYTNHPHPYQCCAGVQAMRTTHNPPTPSYQCCALHMHICYKSYM